MKPETSLPLYNSHLSEQDWEEIKLYRAIDEVRDRNTLLFIKVFLVIVGSCLVLGIAFISSFDSMMRIALSADDNFAPGDSTQLSESLNADIHSIKFFNKVAEGCFSFYNYK